MAQELFDIGNDLAVNCNPGGRFHGWLFRKHPGGQYVSVRKLNALERGADVEKTTEQK